MPQVTMTMEEYLALINGLNGDAILGSGEMNTGDMTPPAPKKKKGKKNPKLIRS